MSISIAALLRAVPFAFTCVASGTLLAQQAQFTPIPGRALQPGCNQNECILSGTPGYSGTRISGDGQVVTTVVFTPGFQNGAIPRQAARWTATTGTVVISSGFPDLGGLYGVVGISGDGSVIYGSWWRWRAVSGFEDLRPQLNDAFGQALRQLFTCSLDGLVVAGIQGIYPSNGDMFRQSIGTGGGVQLLPRAAGWPDGYFYFNTLSGDGQVLGGSTRQVTTSPFFSNTYAGVIIRPTGPQVITPSGSQAGVTDLSLDGSVAVGYWSLPTNVVRSFRWDSTSGLVSLDTAFPSSSGSFARATNLDGSVVVGDYFTFGQGVTKAFLWTVADGFLDLRDELVANYGLAAQLAGWQLLTAQDVSLDGRAIVGQGINPNGVGQAFLLRFPIVPAAAVAYGAGCVGSAGQLSLSAMTLPYLGTTYTSQCSGAAPTSVGLAIYGLTQQAVPLANVVPQALPNCQLLTTTDLLALLPASVGNQFAASLPIPNTPALVGGVLQQQVAELQFGAGGVLQSIATSNGLRLTIGSF